MKALSNGMLDQYRHLHHVRHSLNQVYADVTYATVSDAAKHAGVSICTAGRVLNGAVSALRRAGRSLPEYIWPAGFDALHCDVGGTAANHCVCAPVQTAGRVAGRLLIPQLLSCVKGDERAPKYTEPS